MFRLDRKIPLCCLLTLQLSPLFSQHHEQAPVDTAAVVLSMEQTWQKANEHSKKIQLSDFEAEIAKEEIREAQFERLPEWQVKGFLEHATNLAVYTNGLLEKPDQHEVIHTLYKIGTDLYLNVYDGNKINLEVDKKKFEHEIAVEQQKFTASEIRLRASSYYLDLQRRIIFRDLMVKDIENQEKQLHEIKNLLKNGVVLKSDELRVELKLSNQKMMLVQIENDIAIANQKLNIILGLPDLQEVDPTEAINPEGILTQSYEDYLAEALDKSFEYHISDKKTQLQAVELRSIRANVRPKVGLYADFFISNPQIFLYPYNPSNYGLGVMGIRASFPISEIYMNIPKARAAKLELEKEELDHHDTEDRIREQVYQAYLRFKESIIRIDVARTNVAQAEENARIVKNNYFNQTALVTDLLDADIQFLQTQFEFASSQVEAQLNYYQLQNILGNL